jgi:hypothetical protein
MNPADDAAGIAPRIRIAVAGTGDAVPAWARALRACEGVDVRALPEATADDVLNEVADKGLAAIVFATPMRELGPTMKRAVVARKHVLAAPAIGDSLLLLDLEELARRRGRALLFDACGLADSRLAFVRRSTRGDNPLRRARHLRVLRSAPGSDAASLEALALEAVSRVLLVTGELPDRVSAYAPRFRDEDAPSPFLGLTLVFPSGASARIDLSAEPLPRDELTVISESRTITLDRLSQTAPLRVLSLVRRGEPGRAAESFGARAEIVPGTERSRVDRVAAAFVEAVRTEHPACNARQFAGAALVWETARSSMARGGEFAALPARHPLVATPRPNLYVIQGGGQTTETSSSSAPVLRVMQGGRRPEPVAPPPRSA